MFAKKQPAVETIIGNGSWLRGELNSKGSIRIDGMFEGRVRADWIIVGESGSVTGDIACRGVMVGGKVEATIHANELVDIRSSGTIVGDVYTAKFAMSEGAIFEGHSHMKKSPTDEHNEVLPFVSERQP